jgi:NAD(P)-dependent dehydrogenase (short-subunit alcohol dehydrogenase family)
MLNTSKGLPPGSVRIVNLSSSGHRMAPTEGICFADTSIPAGTPLTRYGQSKLANVLHAKTLNRLFGPGSPSSREGKGEVWTAVVHPGLVDTRLGDHAKMPMGLKTLFKLYGKAGGFFDADRGSWTSLFCVASLDMAKEQSGTYFQRIAEAGSENDMAKDMDLAERLEEWTAKLMKDEDWVES